MGEEIQTIDAEIVEITPPSALQVIQAAEIDAQIATAHKFPRTMSRFREIATEMATMDEETAASCIFKRPVGGGKFAEGLSVRAAEIAFASYGNIRAGSRIIEQTPRSVKVQGFAHDLERNAAVTCEVIELTVDKYGEPYNERMAVVIAKAALAKARRDAIFQVIPRALFRPVENAARAVILGDEKAIGRRRADVVEWVRKLKIEPRRVWAALNVEGPDDIGVDELETLTGLRTAIKDGDSTLDEAFPKLEKEATPEFTPNLGEK